MAQFNHSILVSGIATSRGSERALSTPHAKQQEVRERNARHTSLPNEQKVQERNAQLTPLSNGGINLFDHSFELWTPKEYNTSLLSGKRQRKLTELEHSGLA